MPKVNDKYTNYSGAEEFLNAFFLDGGQVIVQRFDCDFFPPPSWSTHDYRQEIEVWRQSACIILRVRERKEHDDLLTNTLAIHAAARRLNLSDAETRQLCHDGAFGAIKFGQIWRIYKPSLDLFIKSQDDEE